MGIPQVRLKVNSMIGVIFSKLGFLSLQKGSNYLGVFVGNLNVVIVGDGRESYHKCRVNVDDHHWTILGHSLTIVIDHSSDCSPVFTN